LTKGRDLKALYSVFPNPFGILFNLAPIFFGGSKATRDIIISDYFKQEINKFNIQTHTRRPEKTPMWCSPESG
jgi:hypothetical protein